MSPTIMKNERSECKPDDNDDDLDEPDDANAFVDDERKSSLRAAPCVSRGCP